MDNKIIKFNIKNKLPEDYDPLLGSSSKNNLIVPNQEHDEPHIETEANLAQTPDKPQNNVASGDLVPAQAIISESKITNGNGVVAFFDEEDDSSNEHIDHQEIFGEIKKNNIANNDEIKLQDTDFADKEEKYGEALPYSAYKETATNEDIANIAKPQDLEIETEHQNMDGNNMTDNKSEEKTTNDVNQKTNNDFSSDFDEQFENDINEAKNAVFNANHENENTENLAKEDLPKAEDHEEAKTNIADEAIPDTKEKEESGKNNILSLIFGKPKNKSEGADNQDAPKEDPKTDEKLEQSLLESENKEIVEISKIEDENKITEIEPETQEEIKQEDIAENSHNDEGLIKVPTAEIKEAINEEIINDATTSIYETPLDQPLNSEISLEGHKENLISEEITHEASEPEAKKSEENIEQQPIVETNIEQTNTIEEAAIEQPKDETIAQETQEEIKQDIHEVAAEEYNKEDIAEPLAATAAATAAAAAAAGAINSNKKIKRKKARKAASNNKKPLNFIDIASLFAGTFFTGASALLLAITLLPDVAAKFGNLSDYANYFTIIAVIGFICWLLFRSWQMAIVSLAIIGSYISVIMPWYGANPDGTSAPSDVIAYGDVNNSPAALSELLSQSDNNNADIIFVAGANKILNSDSANGWKIIQQPVANNTTSFAVLTKAGRWQAVTLPDEPTMAHSEESKLTIIGINPVLNGDTKSHDNIIKRAAVRGKDQAAPYVAIGNFNAPAWNNKITAFANEAGAKHVVCGGFLGSTVKKGLLGIEADQAFINGTSVQKCEIGKAMPDAANKPIFVWVEKKFSEEADKTDTKKDKVTKKGETSKKDAEPKKPEAKQ